MTICNCVGPSPGHALCPCMEALHSHGRTTIHKSSVYPNLEACLRHGEYHKSISETHRKEITNLNKAILRKNHSIKSLKARVRELESRLKQYESLGDDWTF